MANVLAQEGIPARLSLFLAPRIAKGVAKKPWDLDNRSEKGKAQAYERWAWGGAGRRGAADEPPARG